MTIAAYELSHYCLNLKRF